MNVVGRDDTRFGRFRAIGESDGHPLGDFRRLLDRVFVRLFPCGVGVQEARAVGHNVQILGPEDVAGADREIDNGGNVVPNQAAVRDPVEHVLGAADADVHDFDSVDEQLSVVAANTDHCDLRVAGEQIVAEHFPEANAEGHAGHTRSALDHLGAGVVAEDQTAFRVDPGNGANIQRRVLGNDRGQVVRLDHAVVGEHRRARDQGVGVQIPAVVDREGGILAIFEAEDFLLDGSGRFGHRLSGLRNAGDDDAGQDGQQEKNEQIFVLHGNLL